MKIIAFIISLTLFAGVALTIARWADLSIPFRSENSVVEQSVPVLRPDTKAQAIIGLPTTPGVATGPAANAAIMEQPVAPVGSVGKSKDSSVKPTVQPLPLKQLIQLTQPKPTAETSLPSPQSAPKFEPVAAPTLEPTPAPQVAAPPPLKIITSGEAIATLSASGVVSLTNQHRAAAGLAPLTFNSTLTNMALVKAQDMIGKGYFAHVSPSGVGVSDLARQVGYAYLLIGENLALGNFKNDSVLVQGWMDSPGHRANILKPQFTEIGVAVIEGTHDGTHVWYAVQEFGLPRSACPFPDESLKTQIVLQEAAVDEKFETLQTKQQELQKLADTNVPEYNQQVPIYNQLVNSYNALVAEARLLVEAYNGQVRALNECMRRVG